jgi:hypothetical protein
VGEPDRLYAEPVAAPETFQSTEYTSHIKMFDVIPAMSRSQEIAQSLVSH